MDLKTQTNKYGNTSYWVSQKLCDYFEPYMDKEAFEQFAYVESWVSLPRSYEFTKRDWKRVVEGFKRFGVDLTQYE